MGTPFPRPLAVVTISGRHCCADKRSIHRFWHYPFELRPAPTASLVDRKIYVAPAGSRCQEYVSRLRQEWVRLTPPLRPDYCQQWPVSLRYRRTGHVQSHQAALKPTYFAVTGGRECRHGAPMETALDHHHRRCEVAYSITFKRASLIAASLASAPELQKNALSIPDSAYRRSPVGFGGMSGGRRGVHQHRPARRASKSLGAFYPAATAMPVRASRY